MSNDKPQTQSTETGNPVTHAAVVSSISVEQHCAVLANATRAALHGLSGNDPNLRLVTLAAFLFHLCQVDPERADKMRHILDSVRDEVAPEVSATGAG